LKVKKTVETAVYGLLNIFFWKIKFDLEVLTCRDEFTKLTKFWDKFTKFHQIYQTNLTKFWDKHWYMDTKNGDSQFFLDSRYLTSHFLTKVMSSIKKLCIINLSKFKIIEQVFILYDIQNSSQTNLLVTVHADN
jgi:hypothetical protein